jgi:hypothetical protein
MGTLISLEESYIFKNDAGHIKNKINKGLFEKLQKRIV